MSKSPQERQKLTKNVTYCAPQFGPTQDVKMYDVSIWIFSIYALRRTHCECKKKGFLLSHCPHAAENLQLRQALPL